MMTPPQVLDYIKAAPFRPFRLHMASGKTFDVRHPEMVKLGKTFLVVFSLAAGETEIIDHWETVSLMLIEYASHLDAAVGT